MLSKKLLAVYV